MKGDRRTLVVAIDGPSASGKSTLGRALARHFEYGYVDSGAVYRAFGYLAIKLGITTSEPDKITSAIRAASLEIDSTPDVYFVTLNGLRLRDELRHPSVTATTAALATLPAVRVELTKVLRRISHPRGLVMDGRDVGTNIFPDADVKLFLIADPVVRSLRRWKDERRRGRVVSRNEVETAIKERDRLDRERTENPLLKAHDAVIIDTSALSVERVKEEAIRIIDLTCHANAERGVRDA